MSTQKTLYLFPDTNVFLQCKPLEQVDWSSFGAWGCIDIVLTRPVQAEIDAFKGKGNGRQASRARTASSLIRQLLEVDEGCIMLRSAPDVRLCLRHDLRRDEDVADTLDYEERDDQLVGTALAFHKASPTEAVRLLTNDTGPMASAKAVGLAYSVVPVDWLLQPETDEVEKREKALKAEIAKYKNTEPAFELKALHDVPVVATITVYAELGDAEIQGLLLKLTQRYPLATDFGSSEPQERVIRPSDASVLSVLPMGVKEVYTPATSEQIARYKDAHAEWVDACRAVLAKLHARLNSRLVWPRVSISIGNVGSRPADDALVVFKLDGKFLLLPPEDKGENEDAGMSLQHPPTAPKGTWKRAGRMGVLANFRDLADSPLGRGLTTPLPSMFRPPSQRDPNGFYFKEGQAGKPGESVSFTCQQWRHVHEPEVFEMDILCSKEPGMYSGALNVTAHAANLTQPGTLRLPLRLTVSSESCFALAEQMVQSLSA